MYKIVILGCENSHANGFLKCMKNDEKYKDIEVIGVYSDEEAPAQKIHEEYGIYVMENYDEFVGQVDGVIVTARHGDNHYKYAKPYIKSGVPMFIDKPITAREEEALEFMRECKKYNVRLTGGSMVKFADQLAPIKKSVLEKEYGKIIGGFVRAPFSFENDYGGFMFYSQHLAQMLVEVFGYYPKSVHTFRKGDDLTAVFHYEDYDVTGSFVSMNYQYAVYASCEERVFGDSLTLEKCTAIEFEEYYKILTGGAQPEDYKEFIAPVYILNAVERSVKSGKEEAVTEYEI